MRVLMGQYVFNSARPSATSAIGKELGEKLHAGSIIALIGELGCGKTLLTRGICAGLGVPEKQVNSPTFILVNEYRGNLPVFHFDFYRINEIFEGIEIDILDYFKRASSGVILVEWAEKIISLFPDDYLQIEFQVISALKRKITFSAFGKAYNALLGEITKL